MLSVCGYRVAWGPWDILTLVSSWAWALVCYLTGNWVFGSAAKLRPTPLVFRFSSVSPGLVVILCHLGLDLVLLR